MTARKRPCRAKNPAACPRHGVKAQHTILQQRIMSGERHLQGELSSLEGFASPFYTQDPTHPDGGSVEGPHGSQLPRLQDGWKWTEWGNSLLLQHSDGKDGERVLSHISTQSRDKTATPRELTRRAKRLLGKAAESQQHRLAARYYEGTYAGQPTSETARLVPPVEGMPSLQDRLPKLPKGYKWRLACMPAMRLTVEWRGLPLEGFSTAEPGPTVLPRDATPKQLDALVSHTYSIVEEHLRKTERQQ